RAGAEFYGDALGDVPVLFHFEQAHGRVRLTERRTLHVEHVRQMLELDGAFHGEIRPRARRQLALEANIDAHRALRGRGIDARDLAGDDAVARVDLGRLANREILGLRFGNADFGFEALRVGHFREQLPDGDRLAGLERRFLQHAGDARANVQRID